ncbi:hypothetical protein [Paenibacillus medicaginis]|uniref:Uncharacterized protein n=1 Tax=Paenibacillus medicaginis TaxID=1470560 RepID=A0ABV5C4T3_9BACL
MANMKKCRNNKNANNNNANNKNNPPLISQLTPQQIAVIAGLLCNALTVDSVLVDKDQRLEIVLSGSLRRRTRLDQLLDELEGTTLLEFLDALNKR